MLHQFHYEIRLAGTLDPRWESWFGMAMRHGADGSTVLSSRVDQAALHRVLRKIADLGIVVIAVEQLGEVDRGAE
jgi:hypothetical protein